MFLLVLIDFLLLAGLFGHLVHWALHQPWAGVFHRAHMDHHLVQYPPGDLTSDRYRTVNWRHSGTFLFTPPLLAILGAVGGLLWGLGAPAWVLVTLGITLVGFGLVNDYVHDSFHVRRHPLNRYGWYRRLRRLHFVHHVDMGSNYGIVTMVYDRVFGTFKATYPQR